VIYHDRFPWLSHRTIAEVAETETLRKRRAAGTLPRCNDRLRVLEARAAEPERPQVPDIVA
jgi:hypothetical protein